MVTSLIVVVGQNSGNKVERAIIRAIDGNRFEDIPSSVQQMLIQIDPSLSRRDDRFHARKASSGRLGRKADLVIECGGSHLANPSLKSGGGNSVHQENIHDFVEFLRGLGVDELAIAELYRFHWGDGTLDGTGPVDQRIDAREIRARFPETIKAIGAVFDQHQIAIVSRALTGMGAGTPPSHLVYTDNEQLLGLIAVPMADVISFNSPEQSDGDLLIGRLLFQNYGRCLQGQDLVSKKTRNDVQFKWPTLAQDVQRISRDRHEQRN